MYWMFSLFCLTIAVLIFISTVTMKVPNMNDDLWVKVRLKINSDIRASWCRVIPGRGVKFYALDGKQIDQKENRVQVIERCLDSCTHHPIPEDEKATTNLSDFISRSSGNNRLLSRRD